MARQCGPSAGHSHCWVAAIWIIASKRTASLSYRGATAPVWFEAADPAVDRVAGGVVLAVEGRRTGSRAAAAPAAADLVDRLGDRAPDPASAQVGHTVGSLARNTLCRPAPAEDAAGDVHNSPCPGVYRWVMEGAIALRHWFRRPRISWEIRDDIHHTFVALGRRQLPVPNAHRTLSEAGVRDRPRGWPARCVGAHSWRWSPRSLTSGISVRRPRSQARTGRSRARSANEPPAGSATTTTRGSHRGRHRLHSRRGRHRGTPRVRA